MNVVMDTGALPLDSAFVSPPDYISSQWYNMLVFVLCINAFLEPQIQECLEQPNKPPKKDFLSPWLKLK